MYIYINESRRRAESPTLPQSQMEVVTVCSSAHPSIVGASAKVSSFTVCLGLSHLIVRIESKIDELRSH